MSVSKKTRFEVFKRDNFTCQYCGQSAPEVLLELDHIMPRAEGGTDDLLNLVTSCFECNRGKSDRMLSDNTVIKQRQRQAEELQERREQLEMLMEWHQSLLDLEDEISAEIANIWDAIVPGYHLNEHGYRSVQKWIKRFECSEIIEAMKTSVSQYLAYADDPTTPTQESVEKAFAYIPKICAHRRRCEGKPYMKDLYYARGILRNRLTLSKANQWQSIQLMEQAVLAGMGVEEIKDLAKTVKNWTSFRTVLEEWVHP